MLPKTILSFQSAFVPNRDIHHNILVTHEIRSTFPKPLSKHGLVAIKLDMKKAYDNLEWSFIEKCLNDLAFSNTWINWIMQCIITGSFNMIVNEKIGNICFLERVYR